MSEHDYFGIDITVANKWDLIRSQAHKSCQTLPTIFKLLSSWILNLAWQTWSIYRVFRFYWDFPGASCRDFQCTINNDQWLIFFPDMGDFVPKWNCDQKPIQNPTKGLSSQMSKFWISAIFDQNWPKKYFFLTNLGWNLCFMKTILCSMDS